MKKKIFTLLVLTMCIVGVSFSQHVGDTVSAVKTTVAPEIDGVIDDVWEGVEEISIEYWGQDEDGFDNPVPDSYDFEAKFKMMWDDEYIYFLGLTTDDVLSEMDKLAEVSAPAWEIDAWEVYWAPTNTQLDDMTEMTQVRMGYANATTENATSGVVNGWSEGGFVLNDFVTAARAESDDGWVVEARFSLAELALSVSSDTEFVEGSFIGINVMASDNDEEVGRKHIGNWIEDAAWNQADTLGVVLLSSTAAVGVNNAASNTELKVYPNPANNFLNITSISKIDRVEVINSIGIIVINACDFKQQIDISELNDGVYFVKTHAENEIIGVQKFVKK